MRFLEFDTLTEILSTMRENKLRSFLTGFAIAWGIFMLIVLLGSGNGLKNGVMANFNERATNTMMVWAGRTTMPYKGYKAYRRVYVTNNEINLLKTRFPEIDKISGEIDRSAVVSYNNESASLQITGVLPDYSIIGNLEILQGNGRFINRLDVKKDRKVIVLPKKEAKALFKEENPIGKWVKVDGLSFQVIGIDSKSSMGESSTGYIPIKTAQQLFGMGIRIDQINFTVVGLSSAEEIEAFGMKVREALGRELIVHPDDLNSIGFYNQASDYVQTMKIFSTIDVFILFIGICTLIAGIVGVGNIMVITVKERTKEFGIRKSLGATPGTILNAILLESVVITSLFGYAGMIFGIGLLELINTIMTRGTTAAAESGDTETVQLFLNPSVDLKIVLGATLLLIISGLVAGYIPARKAVRIKPIEAMRAE